MDRPTAIGWFDGVWKPFCDTLPSGEERLLFLDNLDAHVHMPFRATLKAQTNTLAWMLPSSCTDIVQPVDAGAGKLMKFLYKTSQDEWLDLDHNLELWEGGKMTASQRRVLFTRWVGEATEKFNSPRYADTCRRLFEKTGCFMTADGSRDKRIQPEGVEGIYTFERLDPMFASLDVGQLSAELGDAAAASDAAATAAPDGDEELHPSEDEDAILGDAEFEDEGDEQVSDDDDCVKLTTFQEMVSSALRDGEQWRFNPAAPLLDGELVGKYVAVRISDVGWCAGKVSRCAAPGTKSYNFKIIYDADDVAEHMLNAAAYVCNVAGTAAKVPDKLAAMDSFKPGAWVAFTKGLLPRAPPPRAPLPALEALGSGRH